MLQKIRLRRGVPRVLLSFFCLLLTIPLLSCSKDNGVIIKEGTDKCNYCKMLVYDSSFAAGMVTKKGIVFKFDDVGCLTNFLAKNPHHQLSQVTFVDYFTKELVKSENSYVIKSKRIKTPMRSGLIVLNKSNPKLQEEFKDSVRLSWEELRGSLSVHGSDHKH